ncbi:MAG TPA: serine/threonine-protein kinase [Polyangiaceae bacterium]|nr:serine/threonine-protein kinase [Polyangiaceae bacterium]
MNPFEAPFLSSIHAGVLGLAVIVGAVAMWKRRGGRRQGREPRVTATGRVFRIGPYALVDRIGHGAMGEVYRARHSSSGELRALKLLTLRASNEQRERFEREVQLGAQLRHPNTVAALDHGRAADGRPYFTMDLIGGIDLEALVEREGPQPGWRVVSILRQVAAALVDLHARGLVHRDIKPANILVCPSPSGQDSVKLIDFGLAKHLAEPAQHEASVVGTPLYISPEAIVAPNDVDGRSDLYGLGAVAYFLLSGAPVFVGDNLIDVCAQHLLRAPEPLSSACGTPIDPALEDLVLDCLAKEPDARPRDARELIGRLDRCTGALAACAGPCLDRAA